LIIPTSSPSPLPHSLNATYTYNGLGIISFHKDGVLSGSKCYEGERDWLHGASACTSSQFNTLLDSQQVGL
jgi:hypothetical protein